MNLMPKSLPEILRKEREGILGVFTSTLEKLRKSNTRIETEHSIRSERIHTLLRENEDLEKLRKENVETIEKIEQFLK